MEKITSYLQQLGLSEIEAKLYTSLLKTGAIPVRELAKKVGEKRTTIYPYVNLLIEKGLVMKLIKDSKNLVSVTTIQELEELVNQKEQAARTTKQAFPEISAILQTGLLQEDTPSDAEIKYYRGKLGVKRIYEEALKAKELRSYVNIAVMSEKLPENSSLFSEALKNNKELTIYEIIEDSSTSREQAELQANKAGGGRYFYKFLPKETKLSATDMLIYDGKIGIINVRNKITGVILHNNDLFDSMKEIFDLLWRGESCQETKKTP